MTNMTLGARLREERERLGLTQTEFASMVGASKRTLIRWEGGAASPDADALGVWAGAGLDVMYLVTGHHGDVPEMAPDEELLLEHYRGMPAKERKALLSALLSGESKTGVRVSGRGNRVAGRDYKEGGK